MDIFTQKGWVRFSYEQCVADWACAALSVARERVADAEERRQWLHCEGTWFVGVDTLPNDGEGALIGSAPLQGAALAVAQRLYGRLPLHRGQVSVIYPGYPRPRDGESEAAFRYRLKRDAAHVDGLLGQGEPRRRYLLERHAYILGIPLTRCGPGASPLTVWEGSHVVMRKAFEAALRDVEPAQWHEVDLTEVYHEARRRVFETCPRIEVSAEPGESYLVHRLALHGVAPWAEGASSPDDGRMIVYFRPEWPTAGAQWLKAP